MSYKIKGNNSFLDSIHADIAEMLNLQHEGSKLLEALMDPENRNEDQLAQIQRAHSTISLRLNEILDKYNIT